MSELTPDQKEQLHKARIAALVRKYTAGRRLSEEEIVEIEPYLPVHVLRKRPVKLRGRDIYSRPRPHYAELYGVSVRAINKWIERGIAASPPEPPPLDDPQAFIAWWGKHMTHRVPDKLYAAVRKVAGGPAPDVPRETAPAPAEGGGRQDAGRSDQDGRAPAQLPLPSGDQQTLSTGFLASLNRVRDEEAKAHRRYLDALAIVPRDEGAIRVAQKTWQDLSDHLRALEKAAPEVLRKSGDLWPGPEIVKELADIHGAITNGVRSLWRRFRVKIRGQPEVVQDRMWDDEVDRLFQRLVESRFSEVAEAP